MFLYTLLRKRGFDVLLSTPCYPWRRVQLFCLVSFCKREFFFRGLARDLFRNLRADLRAVDLAVKWDRAQRESYRVAYATFRPQVANRGVVLTVRIVVRLVN